MRVESYLLMKLFIASLRETKRAEETLSIASILRCRSRAAASSASDSSTKTTISFWFSRSLISASIFSASSETLPMMIRHATMIATVAKDMKPWVVMLRKPSRIR